jgi:hypothetical protein
VDKEEARRRRHLRDLDFLLSDKTAVDMSPEAVTQRMYELGQLWEIAVKLKGHDIEGAWPIRAIPVDVR